MGAFWSWMNAEKHEGAVRTSDRALPERTLVVADFEPTSDYLIRCLGGLPRWLALPTPPVQPVSDIHYCGFEPTTNPLRWDVRAEQAFREGVDTVAFLLPAQTVWGKTLLHLHRVGVRRALLFERGKSRYYRPLTLAAWRKLQSVGGRVRRLLGGKTDATREVDCKGLLECVPPRRVPSRTSPLKIAHFICSLNSGGAERQVCYAAISQKKAGHEVRVLTRIAPLGDDAHYRFLLDPHDITVRQAGSLWSDTFQSSWERLGIKRDFFQSLPSDLAAQVADLVGDLLAEPVDVLHCYVDDCNVPGAIAALLTGTPVVVLSFRNGNPTNFPGLLREWMWSWYRAVIGCPGVLLSSNSDMGARDYEQWLGLAPNSVAVVRNAFHAQPIPEPECALDWRRRHGIAESAPLVAGVFRLQPEKRPLYFLDCITRLRELVPGLRVVLAGVGVLEEAVKYRIAKEGLQDVVLMVGQQKDVPLLLAASDVLLLVSNWEGTPNTLLEAQHYGCVPVATDAGGSREAILDKTSGILMPQNDLEGTCQAVAELLSDPKRRRSMIEAGRAFVARTYAPRELEQANLRLYKSAFT